MRSQKLELNWDDLEGLVSVNEQEHSDAWTEAEITQSTIPYQPLL